MQNDPHATSRILQQPGPLTRDTLNQLRAAIAQSYGIADNPTWVISRLNVELIDRLIELNEKITHLDNTSAELINTTNTTTNPILYLTVQGLIFTIARL